jgi:hypothetical protein
MKRSVASLSPIWRVGSLAVLPLLLGAKGGCGGDVQVGKDQDPVRMCSADDCKGLQAPAESKLCSDGSSLGRTVCATKSDGTCFWDFPACPSTMPSSSCTPDDCKGQVADLIAKQCPDGSAVGRTFCTRNGSGQCYLDFPPCPAVDSGTPGCTMADCQGKPVQDDAKLCPDGTALGRSVCTRNVMGVCNWDFPACPAPPAVDAGCGCVPDIKWGPNGGLVAYQDGSSIAACFDYKHERVSYRVDAGNPSCHETLLGCGSGLRSGHDIVAFLDLPDVKQAIAAMKVVYGIDTRPSDGSVFRIEVGGAIIDVGSPCTATGGCTPIPGGVSMLVDELRAIDAQELLAEPCKTTFPGN